MLTRFLSGPASLAAIAACLTAPSVSTFAADAAPTAPRPPRLFSLGTPASDTTLAFECDLRPSGRDVQCEVVVTTFTRPTPESAAKAKAELARLATMSEADYRAARREFSSMSIDKLRERLSKSTPAQAAYVADLVPVLEAVQKAADRSAFIAAVAKVNQLEESTCKVAVKRQLPQLYTQSGPTRWVSNPGPAGLCGAVIVQVLETDDRHQLLWTHTQTVLSANTEHNACRSHFKDQINKPVVHSWEYRNTFSLGCKYLTIE